MITVYCQSLQCGERSNAVFGRQSAAVLPSHAPHGSKARLQNGLDLQKIHSEAVYTAPDCAARAVLQAIDCRCKISLGRFKGHIAK